jgi:hypothetical protein
MKWFIKILLDTWAFASPPGVSDQFWWWFLYHTLLEIRVSVTSNFPKIKAFNNPQHGEFYADNLDMPDKVWWGWEGTVSGGGHLICYMACVISAMPRILWKSSCRFQTFPTEDFISDICNWGKLFGTINFCCIPSVLMASLVCSTVSDYSRLCYSWRACPESCYSCRKVRPKSCMVWLLPIA